MANKLMLKRGTKAKLPALSVGEPAFTTDTKELFVGATGGNVQIPNMTQLGNLATVATHSKAGTVHSLTLAAKATTGIQLAQFKATADYTEGNTWKVGGVVYTAKLQGEEGALPNKLFVVGDMVSVMLDPVGKKLGFKSGGKPPVPSIFGDGSDGDLVIAAGQTVVLPVTVPHQSVVEKQYRSVSIAAGGVLKCSDPNAGLVIRCKGNFTCHGTIDQAMKAPKPNPNSAYIYPTELVTGRGGNGGNGNVDTGGRGMPAMPGGGGWSGGGIGAGATPTSTTRGGDADTIDITTPVVFIGGNVGSPGLFAGGGGSINPGASGGNSAGEDGKNNLTSNGRGSGGAGNIGGGVVLLYVGGVATIDGSILCSGGKGGNGGRGEGRTGGGGGGAGGGAIYICHVLGSQGITGNLNVNGGAGGTGVGGYGVALYGQGTGGQAGTIGTVTIKQYVKGMTV